MRRAQAIADQVPQYAVVCSPQNFPPPECPLTNPVDTGGGTVTKLTCTSSLTRGGTATCTVTPSSGVTVSDWKFTDGSNNTVTRTTNPASLTWSGTMVANGTVTVTATTSGAATPLSASIAVNNRTNFTFTAVNPSQVTGNSLTCYDNSTHSLPRPPSSGSAEGFSCADLAYSFNFATLSDNGPNNGYEYVTSASDANGSSPTKFEYIVLSDLLNNSSAFYTHQCGTYSNSNSSGFIAGSQLKQNVFDHEQGSVLSHWSEYRDVQNSSSNNIGTTLEAAIGTPGPSDNSFAKTLADAALNRIAQAVTTEPCGGSVNYDSSQSCKYCGTINFPTYQSCGGAQPVPHCQ